MVLRAGRDGDAAYRARRSQCAASCAGGDGRGGNRGETPVAFAFGTTLGAALLVTLAGWSEIRATDWAALPGIVWITPVYTAVRATALSLVLLQYARLLGDSHY